MTRACAELKAVCDQLAGEGVRMALVHESALMGWGIDSNVVLPVSDVLLIDDGGFEALGTQPPGQLGEHADVELAGMPVRLWSRSSLGIDGPFDVTACPRYECEALAPELVLAKLPYSPDAALLQEQRARLASIVHAADLSDEELTLVAQYVRGD